MPHYSQTYFANPPDSVPRRVAEFPEFGRDLKAYREDRGISQARLAEWIGADPTTISRIESGERNPGRKIVEALIAELEMDPTLANMFRLKAGYAPR